MEFPFGAIVPSKFKQDIHPINFYPQIDNNNTFIYNGDLQTYNEWNTASYLMIGPELQGLQNTDYIDINLVTINTTHLRELYTNDINEDTQNILEGTSGIIFILLPGVQTFDSLDVGNYSDLISTKVIMYNNQRLETHLVYVKVSTDVYYQDTKSSKIAGINIHWDDGFKLKSTYNTCNIPDNIQIFSKDKINFALVGQFKSPCPGPSGNYTDGWTNTCDYTEISQSYGNHPPCCPKSVVDGSCYGCDPDGTHCVGDNPCSYDCTNYKQTCNTKSGLCEDANYEYAKTDKCCCVIGGCGGDMSTPSLGHPACNSHWCCPDVSPDDPNQNLYTYNSYIDQDSDPTCKGSGCFLGTDAVRGICVRPKKK
jgi:hypothetical protein